MDSADTKNLANKPPKGLYIIFILLAALAGFFYGARTNGLFACQPPDAIATEYVGTCNVTQFGDYDHGALWFGLEAEAQQAAATATVLFVGNSRIQFGLSSEDFDEWFNTQALTFYLLGFSHTENYSFFKPLLEKIQPRARLYVINIDGFFEKELTGPANSVMNDPQSLNRYKQKRYWQKVQGAVCGPMSSLCGNASSYVRKRSNGMWVFHGADFLARTDFRDRPLPVDWSVDEGIVDRYQQRAIEFFDQIPADRNCIVLTNVPNFETTIGTADALAKKLRLPLVAPQMEGLTTFDGSHLTTESADRWANGFITALGPYLHRCLSGSDSQL